MENDCYGGGKYCAVESTNANIKGRDIVAEDLRQLCMWDHLTESNNTQKWWDYMQHVHARCYSNINEDCSERAHQELDINWEDTQKCVSESFSTSD